MDPLAPLVIASEPGFGIATLGPTVILVWRARPTLSGVRAVREVMTRMSGLHEDGIALLVVLERHAALPDAPVREAMIGAVRSLGHKLLAMVALHEHTGFAAAAVRSVVVGLALVTRALPLSVASTEIEACTRLSAELSRRGHPTTSGPLLAALRGLRASTPSDF
ncbi:hypothetical protein [Polyangium aurulentum]|uniref:hypothetical protein n=1 Tax=Polyangium aurulentum TaxID=2567896 RepID=UPI0010ADD251|nr:hypothetical protein [Polyangium aurulentum]UQA60695.1 hypothetical protein E8A73_009535 [Polyangium aurulentum]